MYNEKLSNELLLEIDRDIKSLDIDIVGINKVLRDVKYEQCHEAITKTLGIIKGINVFALECDDKVNEFIDEVSKRYDLLMQISDKLSVKNYLKVNPDAKML